MRAIIAFVSFFIFLNSYAVTQPLDYRVYEGEAKKIVNRMTLEEKVGQMTLPSIDFIYHDGGLKVIRTAHLGGVIAEGNTVPKGGPSLQNWKEWIQEIKRHAEIPLLIGTDAIHGDQHVANSVIFPQNIGLGATHDPALVEKIAAWTAYDIKRSGFNWVFAPTVAAAQDIRWGRTYESFGADSSLVAQFSAAYVHGAQQIENNKIQGVLTSTKHFIGDGNTDFGVDEGNVTVHDQDVFIRTNLPGFLGAFSESTGNVMISYSSINGLPMSLQKEYLTKYLFPYFSGFVVSDYGAIDKSAKKLKKPYNIVLANSVNSGIDMIMITSTYPFFKTINGFQHILLKDVKSGLISKARIDEAVTRILQVKLAMGLMSQKFSTDAKPEGDEYVIALKAAEESLIILKNRDKNNQSTLPVDSDNITNIVMLAPAKVRNGEYAFNDIGLQSGGWRIYWQGLLGNRYTDSKASSILTGIKKVANKNANYYFNPNKLTSLIQRHTLSRKNTIAVVVLAEPPYSEFMGDVGNNNPLYDASKNRAVSESQRKNLIMNFDAETLSRIKVLRENGIHVVTIVLSGRPMQINQGINAPYKLSDCVIAAWLPGTMGGQAIANAMFGLYRFGERSKANTLSFNWPI